MVCNIPYPRSGNKKYFHIQFIKLNLLRFAVAPSCAIEVFVRSVSDPLYSHSEESKVMPKSCFVALDKERLACNRDSDKIVYDVW